MKSYSSEVFFYRSVSYGCLVTFNGCWCMKSYSSVVFFYGSMSYGC